MHSILEPLRSGLRHTWLRRALLAYRHFGLSEHDVFLASYPKSGSTWLRVMLAYLLTGQDSHEQLTDQRFVPGVKHRRSALHLLPHGGQFIKTHETFRTSYKRAVLVVRDGRDVAVSYYWQQKRLLGYDASFEDFLRGFYEGTYDGYGPWHEHVSSWLAAGDRGDAQILLVRYEDLKQDAPAELTRILGFLGTPKSDEAIEDACRLADLKNMRQKESQTDDLRHSERGERIAVVRKGVVGDWQNYFSDQLHAEFWNIASDAMEMAGYHSEAASRQSGGIT